MATVLAIFIFVALGISIWSLTERTRVVLLPVAVMLLALVELLRLYGERG